MRRWPRDLCPSLIAAQQVEIHELFLYTHKWNTLHFWHVVSPKIRMRLDTVSSGDCPQRLTRQGHSSPTSTRARSSVLCYLRQSPRIQSFIKGGLDWMAWPLSRARGQLQDDCWEAKELINFLCRQEVPCKTKKRHNRKSEKFCPEGNQGGFLDF